MSLVIDKEHLLPRVNFIILITWEVKPHTPTWNNVEILSNLFGCFQTTTVDLWCFNYITMKGSFRNRQYYYWFVFFMYILGGCDWELTVELYVDSVKISNESHHNQQREKILLGSAYPHRFFKNLNKF